MSPVSSKSAKNPQAPEGERKSEPFSPFNLVNQSELLWWPYRSLSKALLHTHHNTAAFVQINRQLADEFREIARRQQDFVVEFSENLLHQMSVGGGSPKHTSSLPLESIDRYFETAIDGVREFGKAFADAQVRSIEAFQKHAQEAVKTNGNSAGHAHAAE